MLVHHPSINLRAQDQFWTKILPWPANVLILTDACLHVNITVVNSDVPAIVLSDKGNRVEHQSYD